MKKPKSELSPPPNSEYCSTIEVAQMLGLAVRSVQLMVDRGELEAWKTSGGHRRILPESVNRWIASRHQDGGLAGQDRSGMHGSASQAHQILLIEDSSHFQNLVSLLVQQHLPEAQIHIANDGISGLAKFGQIQPDLLLVDILLPGIDGAALITSLRSDPQFSRSSLVIITGLSDAEMSPYAFALEGLPVIRKPNLVKELIPTLNMLLGQTH